MGMSGKADAHEALEALAIRRDLERLSVASRANLDPSCPPTRTRTAARPHLFHCLRSYPSLLIVIKWGEHGALAARGEQRWRCYPYETRVVRRAHAAAAGDDTMGTCRYSGWYVMSLMRAGAV
eukprot:2794309-Pleurochrysis_carterae.AAC.1